MMASVAALLLSVFSPSRSNAALVINEFMASNGSTVADPQGQYDDWIEIYNAGPGTVRKYDGIPPYPETQNYVQKVVAYADRFRSEESLKNAENNQ